MYRIVSSPIIHGVWNMKILYLIAIPYSSMYIFVQFFKNMKIDWLGHNVKYLSMPM